MKPNNSQSNQQSQQNEQSQEGQQGQQMRPPEAAAKRDVQEAERKAEDAQVTVQQALEEIESLRNEVHRKDAKIEELREEHEAALEELDEYLEVLYENVQTKGFSGIEKTGSLLEDVKNRLTGSSSKSSGE